MCVCERERERECVCVRVCVGVRECVQGIQVAHACVCACVYEVV